MAPENIDIELADWAKTNIRIVAALVQFVSSNMMFGEYTTISEVIDNLLTDDQKSDCEKHSCGSIVDFDFGKLSRVITQYYSKFSYDPRRLKSAVFKVKEHRNTFSHLTGSTQLSDIAGWRADVHELSIALGIDAFRIYVETNVMCPEEPTTNNPRRRNTEIAFSDTNKKLQMVNRLRLLSVNWTESRCTLPQEMFGGFTSSIANLHRNHWMAFTSATCDCTSLDYLKNATDSTDHYVYLAAISSDMTDVYYSIATLLERSFGVDFVELFVRNLPDEVMYSIEVMSALVKTLISNKNYKIDRTIVIAVPRNVLLYDLDSLITLSKTKVSSLKMLIISDESAFRDIDGSNVYEPLNFDEHEFLQSIDCASHVGAEQVIDAELVIDLIRSQCKLCTNELRLLCKLVSRNIVTVVNYLEWLPHNSRISWSTHIWSILTVSQRSYIRNRVLQKQTALIDESSQLLEVLGFVDHFTVHKSVLHS